jgi:alpha-glucosidase
MIVAPVASASDKVTGLATEKIWLPEGDWIEWPTEKHLHGPLTTERSFTIAEVPVYLRNGAIVPMEPPMRSTGEKPVDPLIVNLWPLASGAQSSYEVYEDSGKSVEYKHGVFTKTPIVAAQKGDELRVEIGPVKGHYAGMLERRGYELRLPADWPPASVKVNGLAVHYAMSTTDWGWRYEGNTLTTIIPVAARSVHEQVTIVVERQAGLASRRSELDGFAGAMTRLRGAYDAMHQTWPVSDPPDELVDVMQAGDRLGYHPERIVEEIAHFHQAVPIAQLSIDEIAKDFTARTNAYAERMSKENWRPPDMDAQKQRRIDAMARAVRLVNEAAK